MLAKDKIASTAQFIVKASEGEVHGVFWPIPKAFGAQTRESSQNAYPFLEDFPAP